MRVLLLDKEKITKITLPDEIDGVFLMPYLPVGAKNERDLCIEARDNKWVLKSNGSINVMDNNSIVNEIILEDNSHLKVNLVGRSDILDLYCLPTYDKIPCRISVNTEQITIGRNGQCSISYDVDTILDTHAGIYRQNGIWYIAKPEGAENCTIYLNDYAIENRHVLKVGDIVFINGLKIVWMQSFIQINNPFNKVMINPRFMSVYLDDKVNNTEYDPVSEEDASIELYKPEDYFFHTPNLKEYVTPEDVVIDPPPGSQAKEEPNFLVTFGASFSMIASSFVSIINMINNIVNRGNIITIITSGIMCVSMLIGSLIMPKIIAKWQRKNDLKREKLRIVKYSAYLDAKEKEIANIMVKQQQILRDTNLPISNVVSLIISNNSHSIWNREIKDEDFLIVRTGVGNVNAQINIAAPKEQFTLETDELLQKIYDLDHKSRILENVPVTFNFRKHRVSAIINDVSYGDDFVDSIILQLAALHSAQDLKLVFMLSNRDNKEWEYAKYLPHAFSDDKSMRFYAHTYDEMKIVSSYLENVFNERNSENKNEAVDIVDDSIVYKQFDSYFVIITDDIMSAKNIPIVDLALNAKENVGFSVLMVEKNLNHLPKRCDSFIALSSDSGCVMEKNLNSQTLFAPEYINNIDMKLCAQKLLNIPLMTADIESTLPTSLSFLSMFSASRIEQLNITNRWKTNDPTISLATPIGVHTSGELFTLDLHEKVAGPHGLIAGSTGSGKSEFIITYILSMAVNYHPDEVQFVLIDYKGGGLAGAFENREKGTGIPHIAGTITNLDVASMNRSLVSINSELKRREQAFMDARDETGESTLDIYKYQKYYREGIVKEPISHLFIISDEFAELKAQQPDFMQELISTARIGRSLGVHLILATQKPSGVVNEQIWSNTRFRVCLKVQTAGDSNEMLKKPDAASLKDAGRFYLQVGFDEYYDIGQSGWAGARYVPSDRIIKKIDDSLYFINNVGATIKSSNDFVKKDTNEDLGDQLTNIVNYLDSMAKKENYKPKKLWLDPLPETIYLNDVRLKYNYSDIPYQINPVIGEYDNPRKQDQGLLTLNLTKGNTYIFGKSGAGKEDLLSTIIYDTCTHHSPEEVNFYIIDMGAETLRQFIKYPHVADVCTVDDGNKIIDMMVMMEKEITRRKDLTVDFGGSYESYNVMNEDKLPLYCVIINNLEVFSENFSKVADLIIPLYRDGSKYGVNFLITSNSGNVLRSKTREYFINHLCMQMGNADDYGTYLNNCPRRFTPAPFKGRGLIEMNNTVLEYQSALIAPRIDLLNVIKNTVVELTEKYQDYIAMHIPTIPEVVNVDGLLEFVEGMHKVPIGYDLETKDKFFYNFKDNKTTIITGNSFNEHFPFLNALMLLLRKDQNVDLKVIDFESYFDILTIGFTCYQSDFNNVFGRIVEESESLTKDTYYLFTGISKYKKFVKEENLPFISQYFIDCKNNDKIHFIFIDLYSELNMLKLEDWYEQLVDSRYGIWLGPDVASQLLIKFDNITMDDRNMTDPDYLFAAIDGRKFVVKKAILKDNDEGSDEDEQ